MAWEDAVKEAGKLGLKLVCKTCPNYIQNIDGEHKCLFDNKKLKSSDGWCYRWGMSKEELNYIDDELADLEYDEMNESEAE